MTYPYGVHIAVVCIDRETGAVKVERYLIAYDVGRAVNLCWSKGSWWADASRGSAAPFAKSFSTMNRASRSSVTFADYLIPSARDAPAVDVLLTEDAPSPRNPLGLKGPAKGESMRSARRSRRPSTMLSAARAPSLACP